MKKEYVKPEIVFEDFSISTNIAAGCEERPNAADANSCGVKWGKSVIFTTELAGCKSKVIDGAPENNGLCYHNPSSTYNVFNS